MTRVKITAEGHLGKFEQEYFIEVGKEFRATAQIMRDFFNYVRAGHFKRWNELFDALAELEKLEVSATWGKEDRK